MKNNEAWLIDGRKLSFCKSKTQQKLYVGGYAALLSEPEPKATSEVSNSRMAGD